MEYSNNKLAEILYCVSYKGSKATDNMMLPFVPFIYLLFIFFNELSYGPSKVDQMRVLILDVELDPFLLRAVALQDSLITAVEMCTAGILPIQVLPSFAL